MALKPLCKRDLRVKRLLLSGKSRYAIASELKMAPKTVYNVVEKLVYGGYIRQIPGTKSPAVYEEVVSPNINPPTGGYTAGNGKDGAVIADYDPLLAIGGIRTDKICPDGYVSAHIAGTIVFDLKVAGSLDDPRINGRGYVGAWERSKFSEHNGSKYFPGFIRMDGQDIGFVYRLGNKGAESFLLYPQRICLDPTKYKTIDDAKAPFMDRAHFVAEIMANTGWVLENPQMKGIFHYGIPHHPIVQFIPKSIAPSDSDIVVDTSHGLPEAEMEGPDDWEKVQIFANIPTHIKAAEGNISKLIAKVDELDSLLGRIIGVQEKTATAVLNNSENIARLVQSDAQLSSMILNNQMSEVYAHASRRSETDHRLEGYQ